MPALNAIITLRFSELYGIKSYCALQIRHPQSIALCQVHGVDCLVDSIDHRLVCRQVANRVVGQAECPLDNRVAVDLHRIPKLTLRNSSVSMAACKPEQHLITH